MQEPVDQNNPIVEYMLDRIEDFTEECKRLRDEGPLIEYVALTDTFRMIVMKLGGLEHEVALAALNDEFRAASHESRDAWRAIWRRFRELHERARSLDAAHKARQKRGAEHYAAMEKSYRQMTEKHPKIKASFRRYLDATQAGAKLDFNPGKIWRSGKWQVLLIDLHAFSVFFRYLIAKVAFIVFRHSFIVITSIALFGFGMAFVMRGTASTLSELYPQWPWIGVAIAAFGYWAKKYYIDPKIRKLQIELETRRLIPLAFQLHLARTMALYSRTADRT